MENDLILVQTPRKVYNSYFYLKRERPKHQTVGQKQNHFHTTEDATFNPFLKRAQSKMSQQPYLIRNYISLKPSNY